MNKAIKRISEWYDFILPLLNGSIILWGLFTKQIWIKIFCIIVIGWFIWGCYISGIIKVPRRVK